MVQFLSINFFLGFLQFLLGFSKVPIFLCHSVLHSFTQLQMTQRHINFKHTKQQASSELLPC